LTKEKNGVITNHENIFLQCGCRHYSNYLPLCSAEKRNSYKFETT